MGGTDDRRGSYTNFLARVQAEDNPRESIQDLPHHHSLILRPTENIDFPAHFQTVRLRAISNEMYRLVYDHLRHLWQLEEHIYSDVAMCGGGVAFTGEVKSYAYLHFYKTRYGAATRHRGFKARFAYIDGRLPVQIEYLFLISQKRRREGRDPLTTTIAIVRRFQKNGYIPDFPWDAW